MSPPRRTLPARMYWKHGRYWYVVSGKWRRLSVDLSEALQDYAKIFATPKGGMEGLIDRVLTTIRPDIKQSTYRQYSLAAERMKKALQEFSPEQVKGKHVAAILDHYRATPNMANRMRTFLKIAFTHAVRWGVADSNPVLHSERFKEAGRERYITDDEYLAVFAVAPPIVRCIMDLCYFTGQRIGDVLAIRQADVSPEGIAFTQEKTAKKLVVRMTPDLREAIDNARAVRGNLHGLTLIHKRNGQPYKYKGMRDAFDRARAKAGIEDFTLHDLRAKSLTDAKRQGKDAQKLAGHASAAMTDRYIRLREVDVADGPIRQSNRQDKKSS